MAILLEPVPYITCCAMTKTHLAFSRQDLYPCRLLRYAIMASAIAGMLCDALFAADVVCDWLERLGYNIRGPASVKSAVALALLISVFLTSDGAYAIAPIIGLSAAFYLIVSAPIYSGC